MTINIQSVHFDADKKLIEFVNEKVAKLSTFNEGIISSDVILKLEKSDDAGNKVAEIKLHVKGQDFFAKKHAATFEEATDLVVDALKTQIKKSKEKAQV